MFNLFATTVIHQEGERNGAIENEKKGSKVEDSRMTDPKQPSKSRQTKYQERNKEIGKCYLCPKPVAEVSYTQEGVEFDHIKLSHCRDHALRVRTYYRKQVGKSKRMKLR